MTSCELCGKPISESDEHYAYHRVSGWERGRKAGGTNAIRCRERDGAMAHERCVDKDAAGVPANQPPLWPWMEEGYACAPEDVDESAGLRDEVKGG